MHSDSTHQHQSLEALLNIVRVVADIDSLLQEAVLHDIESSCFIGLEVSGLSTRCILSGCAHYSWGQGLVVILPEHELRLVDVLTEAHVVDLSWIVLVKVEANEQSYDGIILRKEGELLKNTRELSA